MRLIVREYLSMLRESEELDALLPDLLLSMDIQPIYKPQRGVRQYGVDQSAVGIDPEDQREKLFLFVIKQKDIDRNNWDTGIQAVRPTLNEIFDVYLRTMLDDRFRNLPKKIILCTNGDMKQDVSINWINYTNDHGLAGEIEFDFWGGDVLSSLVVRYLLNEFVMPESVQKQMRKTLAFLDLIEYDLSHFYELIEEILFNDALHGKVKPLKTLRCIHLCLNLVYHWSKEAGNLKHAVFASERVILRLWEWMHRKGVKIDKTMWEIFYAIDDTRREINYEYIEKITPHCMVRDGLSGYGADRIEYPMLVFEQIGIISLIGLDFIYAEDALEQDEGNSYLNNMAQKAAHVLQGLILNHNICRFPVYDSHINDISMALILLYRTNRIEVMKSWIYQLFLHIGRGYQLRGRFPLLNDVYDDLIDAELGLQNADPSSSTLLPMLLEWTIILNWSEQYNYVYEMIHLIFGKVDLQIWFADEHTEKYLYRKSALFNSGVMLTSIELPEGFEQYRIMVCEEIGTNEEEISFIKESFPIIGVVSFRHFRTPIFPIYWRRLINSNL
ncbi:hypothetical protein BSK66_29360 [Paenibacillus odorifer]|uniref:Uncharacterized protein n=1 Tax=Paenibacillus odorifer TaxID=189426 RepID=A0A1R0X3I4_9BACL|nr:MULTISPECIES: hypothetical protein [Paenibacillus]ETT67433.1 hypothetical protein C171_03520 [Paenibacillus sp. FSL H8-237]OMD27893.1 hypothetical protein BJP51_01930 [Paenibacillus odorifer]OME47976.1 hypothetical protein BSK66_29360 [Paenibacillus odorifer]